jgi:hypothetical protein
LLTIKNKTNFITNISHAIDLVREEMGNDTADLFQEFEDEREESVNILFQLVDILEDYTGENNTITIEK